MSDAHRQRSDREQGQVHSAEDVRGAEIILRTRTRKLIFFGGLVGFVVLIFVLGLLRLAGA